MAAISLSSLMHSSDFRGTPTLSAPPTIPRRAMTSPHPSPHHSPRQSPRNSPRHSPRHILHHTPLPTSTNYPTSIYHRPTSPIPRPISPCPRPISPCGRSRPRSRPQSPSNNELMFKFDTGSVHSGELAQPHMVDFSEPMSLGFQLTENPQQSTASTNASNSPERKPQTKNLLCGVCLKSYQDPRMLPCFHSFCASCLESSCLQKGRKDKPDSVYCPFCTETTELSSKGVQGLPKNMYAEHLVNLQKGVFRSQTNCDLCVSSEVAVSQCKECECNLCDFCTQAHRKQRKTSTHNLVSIEDRSGSVSLDGDHSGSLGGSDGASRKTPTGGVASVLYCKEHVKEILEFYCEDCEEPICEKCSSGSHAQHQVSSLQEANEQYSEILRGLLSKALPLADTLTESMKNINFLSTSIQERTQAISEDIIEFVSNQMKVLQEHKRLLLLQLDAVKNQKVSTLELQLEGIKKTLRELKLNTDEAQKALDQGIPSVAFGGGSPIASKLEALVVGKYDLSPTEDDYIRFHSHLQTQESNGLPIYGVLDSKGPSAAQTIAEGEGLYEAREGKSAKFKVVVCDRYKQQREVGGDRVESSMVSKKGDIVYMLVNDCENGVYDISYIPESSGEHRLSVLVDEKHIKGSPFVVRVHPRRSKHNGIFHCCTFCSSGGKRHIRCGCGSVMSGGYSGCGHGHPGHPGCRHWSCCGNVLENSECL